MNNKIVVPIIICLILLLSGATDAQVFGTKVKMEDQDFGFPLTTPGATGFPFQNAVYIAYWDIGATPGLYDNEDVVYLQLGSVPGGFAKIVRANNIRLTGWGNYTPGSKVRAVDHDIGQQVVPSFFPLVMAFPTAVTGFAYMDVGGVTPGYDLGDPIYLKISIPQLPPWTTGPNDIRITPMGNFPAGSKISNNDPDTNRPLMPFTNPAPPNGGPIIPNQLGIGSMAQIAFFNANGNTLPANLASPTNPIYDYPDYVYLDIPPLNVVSVNDVRLWG
ncbi:MAG: hypothetical protein MUO26_12225 [Methanotrichaceae archaeon]|nr:hypothetical protein [Methanotrichaceae archaeon]